MSTREYNFELAAKRRTWSLRKNSIEVCLLAILLSFPPASSMPLAVVPAVTTTPSQHLAGERQHYRSPKYHPYQRSLSHKRSPPAHCGTHSRKTYISANEKAHYLLAKLGDLGVARPNEGSLKYSARMAARVAKVEDCGGTQNSRLALLRLTPYIVISPSFSSPINPITHLGYHEAGWTTQVDTLALLKSSALPFANCELSIPSFAFAATVASAIDVGTPSPVQPAWSSPPSPPFQPSVDAQSNVDLEILAQKISEHLETHPEPIIGSIDNPFLLADKYGIKGVSILSVFFHHLDMGTFTCHFCNDTRASIDDALEHQRVACHYNE